MAGVSDNLYGIDLDTGTQLWKRHFDSTFSEPGQQPLLHAVPGRAHRDAGDRAEAEARAVHRLRDLLGRAAAPARRRRPARTRRRPSSFLPPNGKPYALNLYKNVIYTTTAQGCGGNPNQFYAFDLATKKVGSFNPGSGGMWPRLGPSIGRDGSVYAGSGDGDYYPGAARSSASRSSAVKQNPATKALELNDWYTPSNAIWLRKRDLDMNVTGPVFEFKGKEYLAESSKECRIWLLDTERHGRRGPSHPGRSHAARLQRGGALRRGRPWSAISTWEDTDGTRWVLLPFWGPKHPDFQRADRARPDRCAARSPRSSWRSKAARCSWRRPGCRAT